MCVEGGCSEESAGMKLVAEVNATIFGECNLEVCPAVGSHHWGRTRNEGLRDV